MNRTLRVRGDVGRKLPRRGRRPTYDADGESAGAGLAPHGLHLWKAAGPSAGRVVERLLRHNELRCDAATSKKLLQQDRAGVVWVRIREEYFLWSIRDE
jgi:hypothetical protein